MGALIANKRSINLKIGLSLGTQTLLCIIQIILKIVLPGSYFCLFDKLFLFGLLCINFHIFIECLEKYIHCNYKMIKFICCIIFDKFITTCIVLCHSRFIPAFTFSSDAQSQYGWPKYNHNYNGVGLKQFYRIPYF